MGGNEYDMEYLSEDLTTDEKIRKTLQDKEITLSPEKEKIVIEKMLELIDELIDEELRFAVEEAENDYEEIVIFG